MLRVLLGCAASVAAQSVVVLTEKNYQETVDANPDGMLVEYYAPWCGHCKKLEPEYNKAADMLHTLGVKVPLAKVDATVETKLAAAEGVQGYPTLKWIVGGQASEYDGPRDAGGIVAWIKAMTGPAVDETAPKGDEPFSMTLYAEEMGDFEAVAKSNRKAARWFFVKQAGTPKVVSKHLGEEPVESTVLDKSSLEKFFEDTSYPLYGGLDGDTFGMYMQRGNGMIWTLLDMTTENVKEVVEASRERMTSVAKKLGAEYSVTWTNTAEFAKVLDSMFGITEFPRIVVQTKVGDKKNYIYEGPHTEQAILDYVEKVKAAEVEPHLKSEEVPAQTQEVEPVKVVVGKTLEAEVFTPDKDVLLEVYAPWCGHCKKLEPELLKVGKKVIKEGLGGILTIAKMDGTLNDSPVDSISWSGFPTIVYVRAGSKEVLKYDGARDAKGIWKWIKKNHTQAEMIKNQIAAKQAKEAKEAKKEEL